MKPAGTDRIREAASRLRSAESGVRVLRGLSWDRGVRERFFAQKARELPVVSYPRFDPLPVEQQLAQARRGFEGDSPIERWIQRSADAIQSAARLLASTGTPQFLEHGTRLFGLPTSEHEGASPLSLAHSVDSLCATYSQIELGAPAPACHLADSVAQSIRAACVERFGELAPQVLVTDELSANALAGPRRILVRREACFSDRDVHQLIQHEAFVHVCTSLNGRQQRELPILGSSHPGTARTQEGLAVFAEFISGTLDPGRFRRLAYRVLSIQMAIEGADFLDVYRFFVERETPPEQAFENARRVFRGGVLSGGTPFTKDLVYLDGFLRVQSFLRAVVGQGRLDCLLLLFCGKLDLEDIPALAELSELGLCRAPLFLPPWASDRRFLVTYLTYSHFQSSVRLDEFRSHYRALLAGTPLSRRMQPPEDALAQSVDGRSSSSASTDD